MTMLGIRAALTVVTSMTIGLAVAGQPGLVDQPEGAHVLGHRALSPTRMRYLSATATCTQRVYDRLFFGLGTSEGAVSGATWSRFLADVVTPRFPDGLTVIAAHGQWRAPGADDVTVERSRVVEIAHDASPEMDRSVDEVIAVYKHRYRQHAVMRTRTRVEMCL
jgi:hypothetical protein